MFLFFYFFFTFNCISCITWLSTKEAAVWWANSGTTYTNHCCQSVCDSLANWGICWSSSCRTWSCSCVRSRIWKKNLLHIQRTNLMVAKLFCEPRLLPINEPTTFFINIVIYLIGVKTWCLLFWQLTVWNVVCNCRVNWETILISEPEASSRSVDGRVRRVHLPAQAWVPPPVGRRHDCAEGAEEPAQLQELQVVHEWGGLGSAQALPTCGASCCCMGRGTVALIL